MTPHLTQLTELTQPRDSTGSASSVSSVSHPPSDHASQTASRAGRVLAYWRWKKIRELFEAAGQLSLFDERGQSTEPSQARSDDQLDDI
jgi:hypothetical protein